MVKETKKAKKKKNLKKQKAKLGIGFQNVVFRFKRNLQHFGKFILKSIFNFKSITFNFNFTITMGHLNVYLRNIKMQIKYEP